MEFQIYAEMICFYSQMVRYISLYFYKNMHPQVSIITTYSNFIYASKPFMQEREITNNCYLQKRVSKLVMVVVV